MSRRSSTKVNTIASSIEDDEIANPAAVVKVGRVSPRKKAARGSYKQVEVSAESTPSKAIHKNRKVKEDTVDHNVLEAIDVVAKVKTPPKRNIKTEANKSSRDIREASHIESGGSPKKTKGKRAVEVGEEAEQEVEDKKVKRQRKANGVKEAEAMPLATRTSIQTLKKAMYIGAHISGAGGVHNSVNNALDIGGNSFALFLKSQRKWVNPPLATEVQEKFHAFVKEHKYDAAKYVLPHGSYLVNLAQAEPEKAKQAYDCFLDDLKRCEALGIKLYNFHPGNTGPHPRPEAISRIAANLNKAHKATKTVVTLLENMAGGKNVIGSTFEDLRSIIDKVDDKSRIGVCLDTCHSFAAGYDLRSLEAFKKTMETFSEVVGMQYLKALHLNDSKAPFSSHRDVHANIGTGFLGLRAFHNVVNFEPFEHLPMILETPIEKKGEDGKTFEDKSVWATEIKLLEGLIGSDPESEEFKAEEQRLQDLGVEERAKFQKQVDKKEQRTIDSMFTKAKKSGRKKQVEADGVDGAESEGGCSH